MTAASGEASAAFGELCRLVARLRQACPWDRAQTPASLKPSLLAEAYEALAALDEGDPQRLQEELGDLLVQLLFQAQMAAEAGQFTIAELLGASGEKLVRRHPHVFGQARAETPEEVWAQWEELKRAERGQGRAVGPGGLGEEVGSALEGVPVAMPALAQSQALQERAERAGFRWQRREDLLDKLAEEAAELAQAQDDDQRREELGDVLFVLVSYAGHLGLDAEEALRLAAGRFRRRFRALEELARRRGLELASLSPQALAGLWRETKPFC